jgi:hypothetical protein
MADESDVPELPVAVESDIALRGRPRRVGVAAAPSLPDSGPVVAAPTA